MNEVKQPQANPVCADCAEASRPRTMFVHLHSGKVTEVADVTDIEVTQSEIILRRGDKTPVVLLRRYVYFACCDADEQPSPC